MSLGSEGIILYRVYAYGIYSVVLNMNVFFLNMHIYDILFWGTVLLSLQEHV